jgi:hypothetical protein
MVLLLNQMSSLYHRALIKPRMHGVFEKLTVAHLVKKKIRSIFRVRKDSYDDLL